MAPMPDPVQSDETVPERTTVVVIGGGIVGASAALFLARKGVPVVLCEKGRIAGEQSSRNWGWCRKTGRDTREIPLIVESMRLWEGLNESIGAETGYRRTGILYVGEDERQMAAYEEWVGHARAGQIDSRMLSSAEAKALMPGAAETFPGGIHTPSDGRAEPQKAGPAIAEAARRAGAAILTDCAVREIEMEAGRVGAVVTERGRIACEGAIVAGGAWSRLLCSGVGLRLPQLKMIGSVMRTEPVDFAIDTAIKTTAFSLRRRMDGGYTVARSGANITDIVPDTFRFFFEFLPAFRAEWRLLRLRLGPRFLEEMRMKGKVGAEGRSPYEGTRVLDPAPGRSINRKTKANLEAVFPAFKQVRIAEEWGGFIDVTPDAIPVISGVDEVPGLFIATGFSGHGFGIGPGAGRLVAELATGQPTVVDATPFRFSRFTDGSKLELQALI